MYRIVMAESGYYYVQQQKFSGWRKTGGFFRTREEARSFARDLKYGRCCSRVMEYV